MGSNHLPESIFRTDPVVGVSALLWPRATCRIAAADQTHEVWRDTSAQKDTTHGPGLPCRNQRSLIELRALTWHAPVGRLFVAHSHTPRRWQNHSVSEQLPGCALLKISTALAYPHFTMPLLPNRGQYSYVVHCRSHLPFKPGLSMWELLNLADSVCKRNLRGIQPY